MTSALGPSSWDMSSFAGRSGASPTVRCKNACVPAGNRSHLASGNAPNAYRAPKFTSATPSNARHRGEFLSCLGLCGRGTISAAPTSFSNARLSSEHSPVHTMKAPVSTTAYAPQPSTRRTVVSQTSAAADVASAQNASHVTAPPSPGGLVPDRSLGISSLSSSSARSRGDKISTTPGRLRTRQFMTRMHAMGTIALAMSGCHKPTSFSAGTQPSLFNPVSSGM
mmetsp:Transcript_13413/g.58597  ORF Transcript_13413/g.58597 Transcript_13413/m.58597 type:complete len:224 (-) Transcript_13413:1373-2044(-)